MAHCTRSMVAVVGNDTSYFVLQLFQNVLHTRGLNNVVAAVSYVYRTLICNPPMLLL